MWEPNWSQLYDQVISYQASYGHNVYNNTQQFKGSGDGKQIFSSLSVNRRG